MNDNMPDVCPTELRMQVSYSRQRICINTNNIINVELCISRDYILIVNFILMSLIPFLMLTSLNFSLFRTIQRSGLSCPQRGPRAGARQKRDQGIAAMLILVVLVFGLCNVIRIVINVYEVGGGHWTSPSTLYFHPW